MTKNFTTDFRRATLWVALTLCVVISLPTLMGFMVGGSSYHGIQYYFDDHMVYAGWMSQAREGKFLFENRFTNDPQPGLTLHLYFLLLGNIARVFGIPMTMFWRV